MKPGEAPGAQEAPGGSRRPQEAPGSSTKFQEFPGGHRKPQEEATGNRRRHQDPPHTQEASGGPRKPQEEAAEGNRKPQAVQEAPGTRRIGEQKVCAAPERERNFQKKCARRQGESGISPFRAECAPRPIPATHFAT